MQHFNRILVLFISRKNMGKGFHKERKIFYKMKRVQNSRGKKCRNIDWDNQSIDTVLVG